MRNSNSGRQAEGCLTYGTLIVNDNRITAVDRKEEVITFGEITISSTVNRSPAERDRVEKEFLDWRKQEMKVRLKKTRAKNRKKAK